MKQKIFLFLIYALICFSQNDTTIISDGNQVRFNINKNKIDSSSISINSTDNIDLPNWTYYKNISSIVFDSPPDSGVSFKISYSNNYLNFPKKMFLFEKKNSASIDSLQIKNKFSLIDLKNSEALAISGYKTFSISADNYGSLNLEQGLDIRIAGDIRPGTELSAHLNDQGSSLEGTTREISDFDLIYIQLSDPNYKIIAGDQYVNWISDGFLNQQKKIKGLSASLVNKQFNVKAFGSLSGGSYIVQNILCKDGVQGPYFLMGKGENGYISPVSGTVNLTINGNQLKEGDDYTVDYDLGFITLKNNRNIRDKDLIRAEYEYKLFDYQKFLAGINTGFKTQDSSIVINGSLWTDIDNKNNPIDLILSAYDKKVLQQSGDLLPFLSTEMAVNPKDVSSYSQIYPLYKKEFDANGNLKFIYTQYNPTKPEDCNDFYQVWFIDVGENKGEYIKDTVIKSINIYETYIYTGKGTGRFAPLRRIPAPERIVTGEISGELNKKNIMIKTQIAGENKDKNTFSSKDKNDDNSSAIKSSFVLGSKDHKLSSVWLSGTYNYISRDFSREIMNRYELMNNWNDTNSTYQKMSRQFYDLSLGASPKQWINTELTYGEIRNDLQLNIYKFSNTTNLLLNNIKLTYNGSFFKHYDNTSIQNSRKESFRTALQLQNHSAELLFREEWNNGITNINSGLLESRINYSYSPLNLNEMVSFTSYRKGKSQTSSSDTGYNVLWEQSINCKPLKNWNFKGNSSYNRNITNNGSKNVTLLVNLENSLDFKNLSLQQQYSTNFEKASSFIQVPTYAGKGLGSFMYDSILKEFIVRTPGDWFMQEKEIYDKSSDLRIKKTDFSFNWTFKPPATIKGIIADLKWEGNLLLEEHIDAEEKSIGSWFPGFYTFNNYMDSTLNEQKVKFSNLSYRQDIEWRPNQKKEISVSLYILPSLKKIRTYYESAIETGLKMNSNGKKWGLNYEMHFNTVKHDDNSDYQDMKYKDLNSSFTEKYFLLNSINIYLKECLGLAYQSKDLLDNRSLFEGSNNFYYQLSPGIQWQPLSLGSADLSYTFSNVPSTENRDYRIANGFQSGISHVVSAAINVQASKNLQVNCFYRGELNDNENMIIKKTYNQTLSLEAKVFF